MDDIRERIRLLWVNMNEKDRLGRRIRLLSTQTAEQESSVATLMHELAAFDEEVAEFTAALHAYEAEMTGVAADRDDEGATPS